MPAAKLQNFAERVGKGADRRLDGEGVRLADQLGLRRQPMGRRICMPLGQLIDRRPQLLHHRPSSSVSDPSACTCSVIHKKAPGAISAIALTVTPVKPSVRFMPVVPAGPLVTL